MATYWIGYDLLNHATFGQYEKLISELQRLGAQRILYSDWAMRSNYSSIVIRDHLRQFMHSTDRILVAEVSATNWAGFNLLINMNNI
jgi:hypothetical protein